MNNSGLEVFDEAGRSVFNTNTLGFGLIAIIQTGTSNGSWSPRDPYRLIPIGKGTGVLYDDRKVLPKISGPGTFISWEFPAGVPTNMRASDTVYVLAF